jgi:superoxide dismutase, Fe-Mn family
MTEYKLPQLSYGYDSLEPIISTEQLMIHHQKHHQGYVNNSNAIIEKLIRARKNNEEIDQKSILKNLSFNLSGHILHSLFWENLKSPVEKNQPTGNLLEMINKYFGSIDRFQIEFTNAAESVEGSGWAALIQDRNSGDLIICQLEKHNQNMIPDAAYLMVLDVWEHAYYLDYKNDRRKFIDQFWKIVNWEMVIKRLVK